MKNNHKQEHFIQLCILVSNYANTEPSQTSTSLEGAETSGSDTNLSGNTTKSVQQPYNFKYSKGVKVEDPIKIPKTEFIEFKG